MENSKLSLVLANAAATEELGRALAKLVRAGDVILLYGDLGAGKSTLARALIQTLASADIDVPSPTFTLVQTYEYEPPIWHFDLYRLTDYREVEELGFDESADGLALVEWPERLGDNLPPSRLDVRLDFAEHGRKAILSFHGNWTTRIDALRP